MTGVNKLALGQVKKLEANRNDLADELRKAIAEVERLAHEVHKLKALRGCEYCGAIGDQPHGEYCRTWEGGDA
jgi:hypothetical protein